MKAYAHESALVKVRDVEAPLATALARAAGSGTDLGAARLVMRTRSTRLVAPGFFDRLLGTGDPDAEHVAVVVVTDTTLLVGTRGEKRGTMVLSMPLATLELGTLPGLSDVHLELRSPALSHEPHHPTGSYTVFFGDAASATAVRDAIDAARAG